MGKDQRFKEWVWEKLYKDTFIEKYTEQINYRTPKGILQIEDRVSFYDEHIMVKYGIPDEFKINNEIEKEYKDTLIDLQYDYELWPGRFKEGESVWDHLQRNDRSRKVTERRVIIKNILKEDINQTYCITILERMKSITRWADKSYSTILFDDKNISVGLMHDTSPPTFLYVPNVVGKYMINMGTPEECYGMMWDDYSDFVIQMYMDRKR